MDWNIGAFWITILLVMGIAYFLPTLNALGRGHPQTGAIFVLNLLLGLTALGWVGALVWSCTTWERRPPLPPPPAPVPPVQDGRWYWDMEFRSVNRPARQYPFHTAAPRPHPAEPPIPMMPVPGPRRYYVRDMP